MKPIVTGQTAFTIQCAHVILPPQKKLSTKSPNEEIGFFGTLVPRRIVALWLELVQGNHPTMEEFGAAREQLYRKVEADRTNPFLMRRLLLLMSLWGVRKRAYRKGGARWKCDRFPRTPYDGPFIAANVARSLRLGKPVGPCFRTT